MFHMLQKGDNLGLKVMEEMKLGTSDGCGHSGSQKNDPSRKARSGPGKIVVANKTGYGVCCLCSITSQRNRQVRGQRANTDNSH